MLSLHVLLKCLSTFDNPVGSDQNNITHYLYVQHNIHAMVVHVAELLRSVLIMLSNGVFQHLFQTSLYSAIIRIARNCFTVIPIPKTNNPKHLIYFKPVAQKYLIIKTLEKLVNSFIVTIS